MSLAWDFRRVGSTRKGLMYTNLAASSQRRTAAANRETRRARWRLARTSLSKHARSARSSTRS
eukprot:6901834-Lingulodinium_polyedra.AAC.1